MTDESTALAPELADAWEPSTPPPGFAERVVEAWDKRSTQPQPPPRWRSPWVIASATAIAAATILWLARPSAYDASHGSAQTSARQTIELPGRAVMVAEAGTRLRWSMGDEGVAHIQQDSGSVFYRVDPGPPFDVVTPHGTVEVKGTCFTVEVSSMFNDRPKLKSGLAGAALATAAVVTVYEGQVAFADSTESVLVDAGEQAVSRPGHPPELVGQQRIASSDDQRAAVNKLRADKAEQDQQIKQARRDLAERDEPASAKELSAEEAIACAHDAHLPGCSWVDPSEDTLREMARCGMVRVDTPQFMNDGDREPRLPPPAVMGLTPDQGAQLEQALIDYRAQYVQELRDMYVAAGGGTPETAADLPAGALIEVTEGLLDADAMDEERRRVANERAGLAEAPANTHELSLTQRWVRHGLEVGNDLEAVMAEVTGAQTARAFRRHNDGWPGGKQSYSGKCIDVAE